VTSTSKVGSVAIALGCVALVAAACSATESKGDVDFTDTTLANNPTGGRTFLGTGGNRQTGGSGSNASGGTGAGAEGGTGGAAFETGGGGPASCPGSKPSNGVYCSTLGTQCDYTAQDASCTCVQGTLSGVWDCTSGGG
jgi:hypothetical protein